MYEFNHIFKIIKFIFGSENYKIGIEQKEFRFAVDICSTGHRDRERLP